MILVGIRHWVVFYKFSSIHIGFCRFVRRKDLNAHKKSLLFSTFDTRIIVEMLDKLSFLANFLKHFEVSVVIEDFFHFFGVFGHGSTEILIGEHTNFDGEIKLFHKTPRRFKHFTRRESVSSESSSARVLTVFSINLTWVIVQPQISCCFASETCVQRQ